MSYSEFYMNTLTGASNLNAGSTTSDVGGGSDSPAYTSTGGNFDGTSIFTPTDGQTTSSHVNVGDWVALYNTGDTVCRAIAQVQTVGAGTNGTITIDTTTKMGTVPTSNSGSRACRAGGAWNSLALAVSPGVLAIGSTIPTSMRVNIKAATYSTGSVAASLQLVGTATKQMMYRGYKTTPGDQDTNNVPVLGTDVPYFTFTSGGITLGGGHCKWMNIGSTCSTFAGHAVNVTGVSTTVLNCIITNTNANASANAINTQQNDDMVIGCYLSATTTASRCVECNSAGAYWVGNTIVGGIIGLLHQTSGSIISNVFYGQAGDAMQVNSGPLTIAMNSVYSPTGNGINITTVNASGVLISNNYFSTVNQAAKAAINNTSGTNSDLIVCIANAYFACTANMSGITESFSILDNGTLASEAFVAPASQNFAVLAIAQGIAFPGKFSNTAVFRSYAAVGAVQPQATIPGATAYAY